MRTLFKLIVSLIIAAGICGILIFTGVLQLDSKPDKARTETSQPAAPESEFPPAEDKPLEAQKNQPSKEKKPSAEEKQPAPKEKPHPAASTEPVKEPSEKEPAPEKKTADTATKDTEEPSKLQQTGETGALPAAEQTTEKAAKKPYIPIDADIYQRALSYLYFLAKDDAGNSERRFSEFLETEFNLADEQIDQMLQMTFWKNFLVLQKKWSAGDDGAMQQAFDREVELKKAGFEAKGIHLMDAEINAAKTRLSEMRQQLAQPSGKQVTPAEDSP